MAIVKQYHKDTDTTYVYESVSYWDEEKKQSRSKRRGSARSTLRQARSFRPGNAAAGQRKRHPLSRMHPGDCRSCMRTARHGSVSWPLRSTGRIRRSQDSRKRSVS